MSASRVATIDLSAESVRTGEAVELDIIPAEPPYRFASAFVDFAAYAATAVLISYVVMHSWRHPTDQQQKIFSILIVASATLLVPLAVEALTRGSSLGKWAFSLRVVRDDGGPASLRHIFVRRLVGVIELTLFGLPALVSMFLTTRGKRLGDLAAGTIVVRQPTGAIHPPLLMPPALAAWASTAVVLPVDGALRREALAVDKENFLHPSAPRRVPYLAGRLAGAKGPFVATSDYDHAVPDLIRPWVPGSYHVLGADGFGFSDTRRAARRWYHIDAESMVVRTLAALASRGQVAPSAVRAAIDKYDLFNCAVPGSDHAGED